MSESSSQSSTPDADGAGGATHFPKRRGRTGVVRKGGRFEAAEFVEGEPARGDVVSVPGTGNVSDLLAAARLREIEVARRKLESNETLKPAEKRLLEKAARKEAAQEGDGGATIRRVCSELDAWWVNGGGSTFYLRHGENHWMEVPREDLYSMLLLGGVRRERVGDSPVEQHREAVTYIQKERCIDRAIEGLACFPPGIHEFKGYRVLVRKGARLLEPKPGEWPTIEKMLKELLTLEYGPEDVVDGIPPRGLMVQYDRFLYWMARAVENVYKSPALHLNSQVLILAGAGGVGKSLMQHLIITPILGGRSADPSRYLFGLTEFNEGWMGAEHLLIEDPRPNARSYDKLLFAQMLKSLTVNEEHSLHPKGKAEFGVPAQFVVTLSINDDPDSIRMLPKLTPDFAAKVMLFRVAGVAECCSMPVQTPAEKEEFGALLRAEMPAFLDFLMGLEVPAGLKSGRFGVKHYHHPELSLNLSDDTPEGEFLHLLDHATLRLPDSGVDKTLWQTPNWQPPGDYLAAHPRMSGPQLPFLTRCAKEGLRVWIGSALELQDVMGNCRNARAWSKVVDHNSIPRLLARLAEDRSDRVCSYRMDRARMWIIASPTGAEDQADGTEGTERDPF